MREFTSAVLIWILANVTAITVYAQSPRDQLNQLVEQLRTQPADRTLRERIVKLGAEIKPPPAVPEEANRREGRGRFAFRSAKSNEDFLAAAAEFEEAAKAAPWVAGYYSDLCTIYEKAEKYSEAKRNCELYLAGVTDPVLLAETRQRIAGLEYGIEKASPAARAQRDKQALQELLVRIDGKVFLAPWETYRNGARSRSKVKIKGNEMAIGSEFIKEDGSYSDPGFTFGERFSYARDGGATVIRIDSFEPAWRRKAGCWDGKRTVQSDRKVVIGKSGKTITLTWCNEARVLRAD